MSFVSGKEVARTTNAKNPSPARLMNPTEPSKMIDNQARERRTEGGTDTHNRAEHSLGEIEATGAFGHIGDDHRRQHPEDSCRDNVQQLDYKEDKRITHKGKKCCADWQGGEPEE